MKVKINNYTIADIINRFKYAPIPDTIEVEGEVVHNVEAMKNIIRENKKLEDGFIGGITSTSEAKKETPKIDTIDIVKYFKIESVTNDVNIARFLYLQRKINQIIKHLNK